MEHQIKQIVECTQPWYAKLKQDEGYEYYRVALWGLCEADIPGDKFRFCTPMIMMDGMPVDATTFRNFGDTVFKAGWTEEFVEVAE